MGTIRKQSYRERLWLFLGQRQRNHTYWTATDRKRKGGHYTPKWGCWWPSINCECSKSFPKFLKEVFVPWVTFGKNENVQNEKENKRTWSTRVYRASSTQFLSDSGICNRLDLKVSTRSVLQLFSNNCQFLFEKMNTTPFLTQIHKR